MAEGETQQLERLRNAVPTLEPLIREHAYEAECNCRLSQPVVAALAEALALVDKTGERFYEAELYRLKGELLLARESKNQKPALSVVEGAKGKSQK